MDEKELKTDLGEGNFIFVGSSTDMFADNISSLWIHSTLECCRNYAKNTYLFQTKNPKRFLEFHRCYPEKSILGITMETNRENNLDNAPSRIGRIDSMSIMECRKMATIEPIMDFDLDNFVLLIKTINPEFVNIGADSKGHKLSEPSSEKIESLIKELRKFTKVNLKDNLKRLYEENK